MLTVNQVSKIVGVSIRTLQYYDMIGLLKPNDYSAAGYRLYNDTALERLQQILLFRELEFSLKEIKEIMDAPGFDRSRALEQQIELLTMKKEHLENLISFARKVKQSGGRHMNFSAFDNKKLEEYSRRAKEQWGETTAYREYEQKSEQWSDTTGKATMKEFMRIFAEFGQMKALQPSDETVQLQVKKLKDYISEHYYQCSDEILRSLGTMYTDGGEFTENIDGTGGNGTADFVGKAIAVFCNKM